jgi:AraC family transcriptional regulator
MNTVEMDARTLAYIRVTGPYGEGYDAVCHRLHQWAAPAAWKGRVDLHLPRQPRGDAAGPVPHRHRHQRAGGHPGGGEVEIQLIPAGRYAQSRYLITDRSQYGERWQEHIGDIVAAGLAFGDGPCFELYHSVSNDPLRDDVSFCSSVR